MNTMPESIASENSMIGTILFYPELIPEAAEKVPVDAIYNSINKKIYQTILQFYDDGKQIDNVILSEELKDCGEDYTNRIAEFGECATSIGIKEYAAIIIDKWIRRTAIESSELIKKNAFNNECPVGNIINQQSNQSFNIWDVCAVNKINCRQRGNIKRINEIKDAVIKYYEFGFENIGVSTGWAGLDNLYRPAKGTLNIITGIPGHGKSEFLDAIIINISKLKGWKWAVFSPENYPYELHVQKFAEKFLQKSFFRDNRMSIDDLERAMVWIDEHIVFVEPDENNLSLDAILKLVHETIDTFKIDAFVLDPWNEIDIILRSGENETQYIGRSLSKLRRFAREKNVIAYIVAHPAKMYKDKVTGQYNTPTMYDISGSAHWYNKADNGLCIHRDFINNIIDIHVQKIKFKIHGKVGVISMVYDKSTGVFSETF